MNPINKETLKIAADKVMLSMDEEQYDSLIIELEDIAHQMELIGKIEGIEEAEPMTFPFDTKTDYLREDIPEEPLTQEEALKNAGDVVNGQISLPKVVK